MPFLPVLVFVKNVSTFLWHMAKQIKYTIKVYST